jgi:hypothetical protein
VFNEEEIKWDKNFTGNVVDPGLAKVDADCSIDFF